MLALAAASVLWQLGGSSLYVDEILSLGAAGHPLGSLLHAVGQTEITPPGYFVFLHEWIGRVGHADWVARLPAAACAVGLVATIYALTRMLSERRAVALGAAAIAALSPFELEYAQRAQGYAAVGLLVAVAVTAAVAAERGPVRRGRWMGLSLAACVLALLCNYTAGLVVAPLAVWVVSRPGPLGSRWGFAGACGLAELALIPLLLTQHGAHPARGVGASGALTFDTLATMLEVPFSGRVSALRPVGVVVTVAALVAAGLAARAGGPGFTARRLVLVIAVGEPLCLIVASALGGHFFGLLMINRYAAVAVPFIIVGIALGVEALPPVPAAMLALGVAVVVITGTVENHRTTSYYLDARDAAAYVRGHAAAGDAVLEPPYPWFQIPLEHYGLAGLHPEPATGVRLVALLQAHARRIWLLTALAPGADPSPAVVLEQARGSLRAYGYRPVAARVFPSASPLASLLAVPARRP